MSINYRASSENFLNSVFIDELFLGREYLSSFFKCPKIYVPLFLEFSNGQKCTWDQYKQSCDMHQTCGECLSAAYPDLSNDRPTPCIWCSGCSRGRCLPRGTNCTELCPKIQFDGKIQIEKRNQCPEMECAASDCDKCQQLSITGNDVYRAFIC